MHTLLHAVGEQQAVHGAQQQRTASLALPALVQEIVFIGAGMDQAAIEAQLDGALLTDEELQRYNVKWQVAAGA
jgi:hypothetical protein